MTKDYSAMFPVSLHSLNCEGGMMILITENSSSSRNKPLLICATLHFTY